MLLLMSKLHFSISCFLSAICIRHIQQPFSPEEETKDSTEWGEGNEWEISIITTSSSKWMEESEKEKKEKNSIKLFFLWKTEIIDKVLIMRSFIHSTLHRKKGNLSFLANDLVKNERKRKFLLKMAQTFSFNDALLLLLPQISNVTLRDEEILTDGCWRREKRKVELI